MKEGREKGGNKEMEERMRQVGEEKSPVCSVMRRSGNDLVVPALPHLRTLKLLNSRLKGHCSFEVIYHKND